MGPNEIRDEFSSKFEFSTDFFFTYKDLKKGNLNKYDTIFDFFLLEDVKHLANYQTDRKLSIFCHAPLHSLAEFCHNAGEIRHLLIGINGFPTMLNRKILELSLLNKENENLLKVLCKKLHTAYSLVEDRVGLVTPRIVAMIINEAYFTVMDGTASRSDIDKAMKLGTNYPYGPFEWCKKIGIGNIYKLLKALYNDTKDERYKICPLLKREYLLQRSIQR